MFCFNCLVVDIANRYTLRLRMRKTFASPNLLVYFIASIPVIGYLIYAWYNSSPLFLADDFHLLKTILWAKQEASIWGKFMLLYDQHNEHRIIVPRLLTYINYLLNGHINWPGLILFGNLLWVSILYLLWRIFESFGRKPWMFLPVPFILLQPQYYDNVTWTISILQQSVIVAIYVLLAYLLSRKNYKKALLVCLVATFTHGNGILSFPLGILMIGIFERNWKQVGVWSLPWLIVCIAYFWGFRSGQNSNFAASLGDPIRLVSCFFAFFGGVYKAISPNPYFATLTGFILLSVTAVYLIRKTYVFFRYDRPLQSSEKFFMVIFMFLTITAALVCISRSWSGIEAILAPRYIHYSPFAVCLVYIILMKNIPIRFRRFLAVGALLGGILFNLICYFKYHEDIIYRKNSLSADSENWNNREVFLTYEKSFNSNIRDTYREAIREGICVKNESAFLTIPDTVQINPNEISISDTIMRYDNSGTITYPKIGTISSSSLVGKDVYIYFVSSGGTFIHATRRNRSAMVSFLSGGGWYRPGFSIDFYHENLPNGHYRIGVLYDGKFSWVRNDYLIANL